MSQWYVELRSQCSSLAVAVSLAVVVTVSVALSLAVAVTVSVSVTVSMVWALQAASHPPLAAEPGTAVGLWGLPVGLPPGRLLAARSAAGGKICRAVWPWTVLVVMPRLAAPVTEVLFSA